MARGQFISFVSQVEMQIKLGLGHGSRGSTRIHPRQTCVATAAPWPEEEPSSLALFYLSQKLERCKGIDFYALFVIVVRIIEGLPFS
jgi:hypothetical protein